MSLITDNIEVIITVTEETAINIRVKEDSKSDKEYTSVLVEPWECHRVNNSAWVRESLLFDIESVSTRCDVADQIITLYKIVANDPEIVQVVMKHGDIHIERKQTICDITDTLYDDIDTNVEHIEKHREFFRTSGVVGITEMDSEYNTYNIINRQCTLIYLGYNKDDLYVTQNPSEVLGQPTLFFNTNEEVAEFLDDKAKIPPLVLIVNPTHVEEACGVVDKYFDPIDCVICDTFQTDDRMACMLLSIAKRRGVIIVRSVSAHGVFNFGNGTAIGKEESRIGIISMSTDTITDDYNFLVCIDPRMAQIRDLFVILNKRKNVELIILQHVVNDNDLRHLENYKVYPAWQTKQFSQIDQLSHGHVLHTPVAVLTPVPGIASLLVSCGIFASCRTSTVLEYVDKVLMALKFEPKIVEDEKQLSLDDVLLKKMENLSVGG